MNGIRNTPYALGAWLLAMGLSRAQAGATVRASLGRFTTDDQIERATKRIIEAVEIGSRDPGILGLER
jgi:cysteine sulfinate desulfinase/cysteine desulfurase-like protein